MPRVDFSSTRPRIKWLILIGMILFAMTLATDRALAHTTEELNLWYQEWTEKANDALSPSLMLELEDMKRRHPPVRTTVRTHIHMASVYRGMGDGNVERWRSLAASYFNDGDVDTVLRIMRCESGGNPNAINQRGSSARGLMQIMASVWAPVFGISYNDLYDPTTNIRLARKIYNRQGWNAWTCY